MYSTIGTSKVSGDFNEKLQKVSKAFNLNLNQTINVSALEYSLECSLSIIHDVHEQIGTAETGNGQVKLGKNLEKTWKEGL